MKIPLRNLPDGVRFELIRTGQKFKLINRRFHNNRVEIMCLRQDDGELVSLNHQCIISPIIKPKIKFKRHV